MILTIGGKRRLNLEGDGLIGASGVEPGVAKGHDSGVVGAAPNRVRMQRNACKKVFFG